MEADTRPYSCSEIHEIPVETVLLDAVLLERRIRQSALRGLGLTSSDLVTEALVTQLADAARAGRQADNILSELDRYSSGECLPQPGDTLPFRADALCYKDQGQTLLWRASRTAAEWINLRQGHMIRDQEEKLEREKWFTTVQDHQRIAGELSARLNAMDSLLDALGAERPEGYQGDVVGRLNAWLRAGVAD